MGGYICLPSDSTIDSGIPTQKSDLSIKCDTMVKSIVRIPTSLRLVKLEYKKCCRDLAQRNERHGMIPLRHV